MKSLAIVHSQFVQLLPSRVLIEFLGQVCAQTLHKRRLEINRQTFMFLTEFHN